MVDVQVSACVNVRKMKETRGAGARGNVLFSLWCLHYRTSILNDADYVVNYPVPSALQVRCYFWSGSLQSSLETQLKGIFILCEDMKRVGIILGSECKLGWRGWIACQLWNLGRVSPVMFSLFFFIYLHEDCSRRFVRQQFGSFPPQHSCFGDGIVSKVPVCDQSDLFQSSKACCAADAWQPALFFLYEKKKSVFIWEGFELITDRGVNAYLFVLLPFGTCSGLAPLERILALLQRFNDVSLGSTVTLGKSRKRSGGRVIALWERGQKKLKQWALFCCLWKQSSEISKGLHARPILPLWPCCDHECCCWEWYKDTKSEGWINER